MAEIHIERKTRKKPIWPWILLLLIILGIVAWLMLADDSTELIEEPDIEINYHQEFPDKLAYVSIERQPLRMT